MKTRSKTSATPSGDAAPSEGLLSQPAALDVLFEQRSPAETEPLEPVLEARAVTVRYGAAVAVSDVSLDVHRNRVTAFIGPSGCGKTTLLRTFNRMNDLVPGAVVSGRVAYHGVDVNGAGVDPIEVRRRIGMVFQRPNPFPKSVFDNVAFGLRLHGLKDDLSGRVEAALRRAALWDEVKDRLGKNALGLSGGQQQRLCIARALAVEPDLLLMDEPASALDPISTTRIEDLLRELRSQVTIVIVTHNMHQAARVADLTAFFSVEPTGGDGHECGGVLIEYGPTEQLFTRPADRRTEDYVTGRFG